MDAEKDLLKEKFKNWIILNSNNLPISAPFWDIEVFENTPESQDEILPDLISLGKYNAEIVKSTPFYKPISKIFKI